MGTLKAIFWTLLVVPTVVGIVLAMPIITAFIGLLFTAGMILGGAVLVFLLIKEYYKEKDEEA